MAFFKKESREETGGMLVTPPGEVRSTLAAPAQSYVAPGLHIEGHIAGDAEILVDGSLSGSVELDGRFLLGRRGRIEADVVARSVQISGHVKGNVRASEKIEVLSSGSVAGDLTAPVVAIAEGGICNGKIEMSGALAIGGTPDTGYGSTDGA